MIFAMFIVGQLRKPVQSRSGFMYCITVDSFIGCMNFAINDNCYIFNCVPYYFHLCHHVSCMHGNEVDHKCSKCVVPQWFSKLYSECPYKVEFHGGDGFLLMAMPVVSSSQWPLVSKYKASVCTQSVKAEMIDSLVKPMSNKDDESIIRFTFSPF